MLRKLFYGLLLVCLLLPFMGWGAPVQAQGPSVELISNLNLRTGPGADYVAIGTLPRGTMVTIEGRNSVGNWVLVHTTDGTARGWLASRYLIWGDNDVGALPVVNMLISSTSSGGTGAQMVEMGDGDAPAETINATPLRQGPGTGFPSMAMLPQGAGFVVERRSENGEWLLGTTPDGQWRGWVLKNHMAYGLDSNALEVANEVVSGSNVYDIFVQRLEATPVMPTVTDRARQILAVGRNAGMRATVFSKVGDCHTDHAGFFLPYGVGEYDLGPYAHLQGTIDYFNFSPRAGSTNSFVNESMAASSAFSAAAVLDPVWADPVHCQSGESPLVCEYRMIQPALALIQFGSVDMQIYNVEDFAFYVRNIVQQSIGRGVVPVLTTFPSNEQYSWEKSLQMNVILLDIAAEEQVPLINFWAALRSLPNRGLEDDNFHLSYSGERFINLNGDQNQWGMEMRNLVTLEALHELRVNLLSG
jgi:uncharacterized protein YraI